MSEITVLSTSAVMLSLGMLVTWLLVMRTGNGGWTDVCWTFLTGAVSIWSALAPAAGTVRAPLAALLIGFWSLRLGLHLWRRVAARPEDFRYARLRAEWGGRYRSRMFGFLQLQAAFAFPLVVAVHVAALRPGQVGDFADLLGITILLVAIVGEGVADWQLARFAAAGSTHGRLLDHGLWAWSRHPNFFFEWLGWCAWPIIAIGPQLILWPGVLALIAPIAMYFLLVRVTGVPPIEERMLITRGDLFRAYMARVPRFFPAPPWLHAGRRH